MTLQFEEYKKNWDLLFVEDEYTIVCELIKLQQANKIDELGLVLQKYKEAILASYRGNLENNLAELMEAVILWIHSPEHRTDEQMVKISKLRVDIRLDMEDEDRLLTEDDIKERWNDAFERAVFNTEDYVLKYRPQELTWDEVFNHNYIYRDEA